MFNLKTRKQDSIRFEFLSRKLDTVVAIYWLQDNNLHESFSCVVRRSPTTQTEREPLPGAIRNRCMSSTCLVVAPKCIFRKINVHVKKVNKRQQNERESSNDEIWASYRLFSGEKNSVYQQETSNFLSFFYMYFPSSETLDVSQMGPH